MPCRERATLRRTIRIALVVGCLLSLINQLDVLIRGGATALTCLRIGLSFLVPFVVSNLGVLAAPRSATATSASPDRPTDR